MLTETLKQILTEESHFMTREEERVKFEICKLLVQKGHRKYAERLGDPNLSLNLVDSTKDPKFVAAISFEEATVFISDAFIKPGFDSEIFKQLDVVMRHELAHNLMMHQIRLMHVFKTLHANDDPETAYEQIKYSWNLHELLNWIEDFEISNERYVAADKKIARELKVNGRTIHGLVTEDHRDSWVDMPLEDMYRQLKAEVDSINNKIRNDPLWQPLNSKGAFDELSFKSASMIANYSNPDSYSNLAALGFSLEDIEKNSGEFSKFPEIIKKTAKAFYDTFKDFGADDVSIDKVKDILRQIAASEPDEKLVINHPDTGAKVGVLYTADFKTLISDILKKIIEKPIKLSQDYVDAWTKVMQIVGPQKLSNDELDELMRELSNINVKV